MTGKTTALVLAANVFADPLMRAPGFIGNLDLVEGSIAEGAGGVKVTAGGAALANWRTRLRKTLATLAQFRELDITTISDGSIAQEAAAAGLGVEIYRSQQQIARAIRMREEADEDTWSSAVAYALRGRPEIERALVVGRWAAEDAEAIAGRLIYKLDCPSVVINVDRRLGFLERDAWALVEALPLPRGVDATKLSLDEAPEQAI